MIKDIKLWEKFERDLLRKTKPDHQRNMKIFEAMYQHALFHKALPRKNPLEGIEDKIKFAKAINSV
jgi:hypothetical protein